MFLRLVAVLLVCFPLAAGEAGVDLLIQGAEDSELQPLLKALRDKRQQHIGAWTFWTGAIGGRTVAISRTEVGPMNAAASTAIGIRTFHPKAIINQGTAGGHDPKLQVWDIVIGAKTTDYGIFKSEHADTGAGIDQKRWTPGTTKLRLHPDREPERFRSFTGDPRLVDAAMAGKYARGKLHRGNIGSAHQFNRELDRLKWLRETYGTDTEDMESAFSAAVAAAFGVPFVAVRIVSDNEWHHPTFERIAGQYCAEYVLSLVPKLPVPAESTARTDSTISKE